MQELTNGKKCYFCGKTESVVGHHIIFRSNQYLRHYHKNILPVCTRNVCVKKQMKVNGVMQEVIDCYGGCHQLLHDGHLDYQVPDELLALKNISLKQYLVEAGICKQDFLKDRYDELNFIIKGDW